MTTTTTTTRRDRRDDRACRVCASSGVAPEDEDDDDARTESTSTRRVLVSAAAATVAAAATGRRSDALVAGAELGARDAFTQTFPILFKPFYGRGYRATVKRELVPGSMWATEQNIELGPLETTIRCVVVKLRDGSLWVHAPLAPTEEFFEFVESCGDGTPTSVAHVVVPTYALEHKIFAKDALKRWRNAKLYTAPGQFTFPIRDLSDEIVFGRRVDGVLEGMELALVEAHTKVSAVLYMALVGD